MWVFSIILSIIYLLWLTRLIDFATRTGNRIAVATEASAAHLAVIVQALPPEVMERIAATKAAEKALITETAKAFRAKQQHAEYRANIIAAGIVVLGLIAVFVAVSMHG